jgi:hypothetical protein
MYVGMPRNINFLTGDGRSGSTSINSGRVRQTVGLAFRAEVRAQVRIPNNLVEVVGARAHRKSGSNLGPMLRFVKYFRQIFRRKNGAFDSKRS